MNTPVISPLTGVYASEQVIEIACSTDGAEIYYTLDGSTVSKEKIRYTEPIAISSTTAVRAKGYKNGMSMSDEATEVITIN